MRYSFLIAYYLLFFSISSYAQVKFEPGYIIDLEGNKTACLIKNLDWKNNPTSIEYKTDEGAVPKKASVHELEAFGINGQSKYIRAAVDIDRSSEKINELSFNKQPQFQNEILFLKVLIEGEATLYSYEDGNLSRFFFQTKDSPIQQLVYKQYKADNVSVGTNTMFRQQLWTHVRCQAMEQKEVEYLEYKRKALVKYFIRYNTCLDFPYEDYKVARENKASLFNIKVKAGVDYSTFQLELDYYFINETLDKVISPRFGLEVAFILPFNRNKWEVVIEPTYQSYSNSQQIPFGFSQFDKTTVKVDYASVELPIGIRHSFYLTDVSKIFVNAFFVVDFAIDSSIELTPGTSLDVKSATNLSGGVGYAYKRLGAEIRYSSPRDLTTEYKVWRTKYSKFSLVLGYRLF